MIYTVALILHVIECVVVYQIGWIPVEQILGVHYLVYLLNIFLVVRLRGYLTNA